MGSEKLLFRLEQPHGSGDIYIAWQKGTGTYLVTTGYDSVVNIFDRYGQLNTNFQLPGLCSGFSWDNDGDLLAVISENSTQLTLWDANQGKKQIIDLGIRDTLSCLYWAKTGPILAVGTAKGNLSIYNHNIAKRIPVIGKHTKRITCGAWNTENLLALGSEDRTLSISNAEGDTLRVIALRSEPAEIQFSEMKLDERISGENTVSVIVGKRTLYMYNLLDPENPIELAFQQHYGHIVTYKWFGDGYILLGFSAGFLIAISTHIKEVGQELFQVRNHKNSLTNIAISPAISKIASCGDNTVKIHDMSNLQETSSVLMLTQETGLDRIAWSEDGQLLAVCTHQGSVNVYLSQLPTLTAVSGARIAILSSLMEVSLYNYASRKTKSPLTVKTEMEPSFISLGPYHLAAGMNNHAWFYDFTRTSPRADKTAVLVGDREYLGAVVSMKLNTEYASVLYDGKIQLHMIEQPEVNHEEKESKIFPDSNNEDVIITSHCLTTEFLIYSTDDGHIYYFFVEDWAYATEFRHSVGIREIYCDPAGTRLVFLDEKSHGYVFNPVNNDVISVPELPTKILGIIWDSNLADRNVFILYDEHNIYTYIYIKHSIYGSSVTKIGKSKIVAQQIPLLLHGGDVTMATNDGQLTQLTLSTHDNSAQNLNDKDNDVLENILSKQLALQRYNEAWKTCTILNRKENWINLATHAMKHLEIDFAIRVYRKIEEVSLVWSLQDIADTEDFKLLSGHIAMFVNEYDKAEDWYLKSNQPTAALDMRRDLLQWDQALQLAKKLDPSQIPFIAREYAQQLEFMGNYPEALVHYEKGLQDTSNLDHISQCKAGVARMSIRCGNYKHGINIILELNNRQLLKDCADILDTKKQTNEAAILYEKSQYHDKAAMSYIKLRNWQKVGELIPLVTSNKILLLYAKAKEQEGSYEDAANAYMLGKDYDSVIRLQLEFLNNPEAAVELVQETKSIEGAKLVARFFQRLNDFPSAIRFLVLSRCHDEAFELARRHGKLQLYGEVLVNSMSADDLRPQDFRSLALYFENERNSLLAGKYYFHSKDYDKAMKHLLRSAKSNTDENEAVTIAIDVIASSNDEVLANLLIEFLLGEADGLPKDPKYLFRLYMARKEFKDAAKTAVIIANEEQINGNYRNAHDVLFSMYQELRRNKITIPSDMHTNLTLLHSYILVRLHVRHGDHLKGARMLIRVANNISKFPSHIVPILTSTVIECHRAGLKQAAFTFATMLMRPENRSKVDAKYIKKIEAVVRKPPRPNKDGEGNDPSEPLTPCPYCEYKLPETEIACSQCKNGLPFCIVTGRHIIINDLTACPECDFPAIRSEFLSLLEKEDSCPMCSEKVDSRRLVKIEDTKPYLNTE